MSPDDRRAALIEATIPLIRRHGAAVTTRQIADAAGVAEGTIFRVFDDKATLIREAVAAVLDPHEVEERLAAVDRTLPLVPRVLAAVEIIQQRLTSVFELLTTMEMTRPPEDDDPRRAHRPAHTRLMQILTDLIEPDRDALRCEPAEVARLLRVLTFTGTHPAINDGHILTAEQIVSLLLDGVRHHPGVTPC